MENIEENKEEENKEEENKENKEKDKEKDKETSTKTEQSNEVKKKSSKSKKKTLDVKPKNNLTIKELKTEINKSYVKSNDWNNIVKEAVNNIISKQKKSIIEIVKFVDNALIIKKNEEKNGKLNYIMEYNLTNEQLEFLAIKIPIVCLYAQEFINDKSLDSTIAEYIVEDTITEKLKNIRGGDAKERLRFAQQQAEIEFLVSTIKKQIHINLKSYVDRADKIYEGVKKVLDGKNKEKNIFSKSNKFSS